MQPRQPAAELTPEVQDSPPDQVADAVQSASGCPLGCGGNIEQRGEYTGYAMAACADCRLVFTVQREFEGSLYDQVYSQMGAYHKMMAAAERTHRGEMGYADLSWFKRMALRWMSRLSVDRSVLDVGCGPGTFLLVALGRGFEVAGVEPAAEAGEKARELGLDVFTGTVEQFEQQSERRFGMVTSFEVLEHVPDPVAILRVIRRLMSQEGRLIVSVPNVDDPYCLRQRLASTMPPVHINFFNRSSMRRALEAAGFEVERFFTLPVPMSSMKNVEGKRRAMLRLPWMLLRRLTGRADGTTLLTMARPMDRPVPG